VQSITFLHLGIHGMGLAET